MCRRTATDRWRRQPLVRSERTARPRGAMEHHPPVAEVVCHGDLAPYNTVYRDGGPVALIDFDTAHPGPRVWDLAYAAYRFVPLTGADNQDLRLPVAERSRRLRLFAHAYALDPTTRKTLPHTAAERLEHLVRHLHEQAAAGVAAFARHIADGHDALYRADRAHIVRHEEAFVTALLH
ncbi:phosphotransferase [Streptomyces sp. 2112.3]|uniref:phosphotransferase n=1 Tax=Streptomyces sp. 2112.3 TaxID=1881023 RepID=UPI00210A6380|nr:phosphotransferase [Streptomyces sp. 2112.3]